MFLDSIFFSLIFFNFSSNKIIYLRNVLSTNSLPRLNVENLVHFHHLLNNCKKNILKIVSSKMDNLGGFNRPILRSYSSNIHRKNVLLVSNEYYIYCTLSLTTMGSRSLPLKYSNNISHPIWQVWVHSIDINSVV